MWRLYLGGGADPDNALRFDSVIKYASEDIDRLKNKQQLRST